MWILLRYILSWIIELLLYILLMCGQYKYFHLVVLFLMACGRRGGGYSLKSGQAPHIGGGGGVKIYACGGF